jgi:hypothetical protein
MWYAPLERFPSKASATTSGIMTRTVPYELETRETQTEPIWGGTPKDDPTLDETVSASRS